MKTKLLLTFCCLASAIMVMRAQDTIIKTNGDEIKAKVTEVDVNEIKYKRFDNLEGPTYTVAKSDVFKIKYENGEQDMFGKSSDASGATNQKPVQTQNTGQSVSANRNTGTGQRVSSYQSTNTAQRTSANSSVTSTPNATEYRHKSPAAAFWLSFLYPGIGQFYNGQVGKGITMCALATSSWIVLLGVASTADSYGNISDSNAQLAAVSTVVLVGTYIWSLIDAPVSASAINRRHQPLSWNVGKDRKLSIVPDVLSDNSTVSKISRQSPAYGLSLKLDF